MCVSQETEWKIIFQRRRMVKKAENGECGVSITNITNELANHNEVFDSFMFLPCFEELEAKLTKDH